MKDNLLALLGAIVGGAVGYLAFFWLVSQGMYGLILPGGLLGLGAGVSRNRSIFVAVACGVMAGALGLYTEFRFAPFNADGRFSYFLLHAADLKPMTQIMIAVGALLGFWVPFRRRVAA